MSETHINSINWNNMSVRRVEYNTISSLVKAASYAVRGPIVSRSLELSKQLLLKDSKLPFSKIVSCNIGNPHSLGQKPLTFMRDVLSLVVNPSLKEKIQFNDDVINRAQKYLSSMPGVGAYSESQGILQVREEVCSFLLERDSFASDPSNIFLTNGASEGVRLCMQTILRDPSTGFKDGVLTPIPQYPLYSALTTLLQGNLVPYFLDEEQGWNCSSASLSNSLDKANKDGITTRGLVVINPGNPTGQILTEADMRSIVEFCVKENICLLADEVYQENIWNKDKKFVSFRKVANDMGVLSNSGSASGLQLISFHSISKGFLGECGIRGGYFELLGFSKEVRQELYKLSSISLCSNTVGQIATGIMVQPPKQGDVSFSQYDEERSSILNSLKRRADSLSSFLNTLPGVSCTAIEGAMYAFPSIQIPVKAVAAAEKLNIEPDALYCSELLENTGIVVVPGSGFGQMDGTYHFRTTILPSEDNLKDVTVLLKEFHTKFMNRYA